MRFLDSGTVKETGYSTVIIEHKGNKYVGQAKCHPDDTFSEFTGCRYAQERAEIKALKDEWKQKKHDCDECRKYLIAVSQYAGFDKESSTAKAMFRQLNRRIKEVNKLAEIISQKQFNLQIAIRQQDGFNNKIEQMRLNDNKEN